MKSNLRTFTRDRRGNFGIMMAALAIPLMMAIGLVSDVATMARVRAHLQNTTDAAVLAIAREGALITQERAETIAREFLDANLRGDYRNLRVTRDGARISVSAEVSAGLGFTDLFRQDRSNITTVSTADISTMGYEIGLILDTTGSMKGGKLAAMKEAVNGLIDSMAAQVQERDKLKFALVPFATFVNVGPQFGPTFDRTGRQNSGTGASWLDLQGASGVQQAELAPGVSRFQLYSNVDRTWTGCVESRAPGATNLDISDEAPNAARPETLFVPAFAIDEPDSGGYRNSYIRSSAVPNVATIAEQRKRWRKYGVETTLAGTPLNDGLVGLLLGILQLGKRIIPIDDSVSAGEPKGPGYGCTMPPVTALSTDFAELKRRVNALTASGTTNITEGVAWGMRVLSPGEPFTQGAPSSRRSIRKIMIVLTDGSNVFGADSTALRSRYSSNGYLVDGRLGIMDGGASATNNVMNERTLLACQAAKDQKMDVYTIKLEEPDVATGDMLRQCASSPDKYIDVPNRARLDEAFKDIIDKVAVIRLAS